MDIAGNYHNYFDEEQGKETQPTFFLHRKIEKPYHIDYIFGSKEIRERVTKVEIGKSDEWLKISDYLPVICEFK